MPLNTSTTAHLREVMTVMGRLEGDAPDAELVDRIRLLEEIKSAAAAAQARATTTFVAVQEEAQRRAGVPERRVGKGIAAQVALARRESPARAQRYVGWSQVLTTELPRTYAALARGRITEWRAQIVARETMWLSREDRSQVDREISGGIEKWGDRQVEAEVKKLAYRLDPRGFVERSAGKAKDRRVTVRPAPETMSYLTGYLPVAQGVAVFASLKAAADSLKGLGDERSRDQIMADLLVQRVTGQSEAEPVPVEISVVMTDQALFNTGEGAGEPAHVDGFGPVPAELARRLLLAGDAAATVWLRRVYVDPETGELAAIDARRRLFEGPTATTARRARPVVPHPLVRRPDPPRRPRGPLRRRRTHRARQRARPLRGLQPGQGSPRLDRAEQQLAAETRPGGDQDADRSPLPQPRPRSTPSRTQASAPVPPRDRSAGPRPGGRCIGSSARVDWP